MVALVNCPGCDKNRVRKYGPERCSPCQVKLDAEHAARFKALRTPHYSRTGRPFYASVGEQLALDLEACRGDTRPGKPRKVDLERRGEQAIDELGLVELPKRGHSARLVYESMGGEILAVELDRLTGAEYDYIKHMSLRATPARTVTWPSQDRTPIQRFDLED